MRRGDASVTECFDTSVVRWFSWNVAVDEWRHRCTRKITLKTTSIEVSGRFFFHHGSVNSRLGWVLAARVVCIPLRWSRGVLLRFWPRTIPSLRGPGIQRPLEPGPKKGPFSHLNDACTAHVSLSPGSPSWNANLSGVLLCFYTSSCNR